MKKIYTLIATAFLMVASASADSNTVTFTLSGSISGTGGGTGTSGTGTSGTGTSGTGTSGTGTSGTGTSGTGTGSSKPSILGTITNTITNDGVDTYTVKDFMGSGVDFRFKLEPNATNPNKFAFKALDGYISWGGGAWLAPGGKNGEVTAGVTPQLDDPGNYTNVIFQKDGVNSFKIEAVRFMWNGSTGTLNEAGTEVAIKFQGVSTANTGGYYKWQNSDWSKVGQPGGASVEFTVPYIKKGGDGPTAIEDVLDNDSNAPVEYYNLQGVRINEPAAGQVVIRRQGSKVSKVVVR